MGEYYFKADSICCAITIGNEQKFSSPIRMWSSLLKLICKCGEQKEGVGGVNSGYSKTNLVEIRRQEVFLEARQGPTRDGQVIVPTLLVTQRQSGSHQVPGYLEFRTFFPSR